MAVICKKPAANLFAAMRRLDSHDIELFLGGTGTRLGLGKAINGMIEKSFSK